MTAGPEAATGGPAPGGPAPGAETVRLGTAHVRTGLGRMPRQVDGTTCGIAALAAVAARAGRHPRYLDPATPRERIDAFQTGLHLLASRVPPPWPLSRGTSPWAVARLAGRATGVRYRMRLWGADRTRDLLDEALMRGQDAFLFVGGGSRGAVEALVREPGLGRFRQLSEDAAARLDAEGLDLVPRHVVAVLGPESAASAPTGLAGAVPARYAVFEPSSGRVFRVGRDVLVDPDPPRLPALGHWRRPLLAVLPAP